MENRLKYLEKQKLEQNEQINRLMQYQLNQNRLNKSSSMTVLPVAQVQNPLLLTANNVLQPMNYMNNLDRYYDMNNNHRHQDRLHYRASNTDNELYRKHKKLYKNYQKNLDEIKGYLERDKLDEKIDKKLKNKIYKPIRNDINSMMEEINYNIQKKLENDNNVMNNNINAVERNYDEMKFLLQDKIDKMELKQKINFENLKNELQNSAKKMNNDDDLYRNSLLEMKMRIKKKL